MKANIIDLRYRMRDVLKALNRNEDVNIVYRGKLKGVIRTHITPPTIRITDHPFFNMRKSHGTVEQEMKALREGRYRAL